MANLNMLVPVGILFVVAAIALSLGASVVTEVQADQTVGSYASNISGFGLNGMNELASWIPTIALVVAAAIIIGLVVRFLGN